MQYEIATGGLALSKNGSRLKLLMQGEPVPEGMLSDEEIRSLLEDGRIRPLREARAGEMPAMPPRRGKWSVSPSQCAGKDLEALLLMVLAVDPEYDVSSLPDEATAVRQLTADWHPTFDEEVAQATDRTAPRLMPDARVRRGSEKEMSPEAAQTLERARLRAEAEAAEKGVRE